MHLSFIVPDNLLQGTVLFVRKASAITRSASNAGDSGLLGVAGEHAAKKINTTIAKNFIAFAVFYSYK
jgi:hypothetical protein